MSAAANLANGPFQGQTKFKKIGPQMNICQLNVEGLSRSKCEYLGKFLAINNVDVIALQETHIEDHKNSERANIPGFRLVGEIGHHYYGIATYVRLDIVDVSVVHEICDDNIYVLAVKVSDTTIVNVYKPPNILWPDTVLPRFDHPALYVGDFNSHHSQWAYSSDDENGIRLVEWAEMNNLVLVFDAKEHPTFHSARWQRGYSPDLCFCSCDRSSKPMEVKRKVLDVFPHSQHRPVCISIGIQIPLIRSFPRPRWNFGKANWESFSKKLEDDIRFIPPSTKNYDRFAGLILSTARKYIPRGFRGEYIPGWSAECEDLYNQFTESGDSDTADLLLSSLDTARRDKWLKTVEGLDFTRSSRKAWSLLRKLSSGKASNSTPPVTPDPNKVAKRIVGLSKSDRQLSDKHISYKLKELSRCQQAPLEVSRPFSPEELDIAVSAMPVGKAAGPDGIFPEFIKNTGLKVRQWLLTVYNKILSSGILPIVFKKSKIVAVLKPGKPSDSADSYRPIALLCVCYKLLERLIYNRIFPILNTSIPLEQAGFRPGRNCCDQVLALTSFIENGFERNVKTSVAFVDLSAAYDTVWRKGLLIKIYNLIPCPLLLKLLNAMISNRLIKVHLGNKESSFRHLHDGLPQGSVLAPLLFNVYTADIPDTQSRKFIYADDIAMASQHKDVHETERVLTADLNILNNYFKKWKLRPNPSKTEVSCFHLNNRLANYKLNIALDGVRLKHNEHPRYLGVTLDRSLTYKNHLQNTAAKVGTRANIVQHLAGSTWGANAKVLRTTALSLVYTTAEYCAPVWLNSAHVSKVDVQLNRVMRTISGTLMATPLPWLPVLCNIAPPADRRKDALLNEYTKLLSAPCLPIMRDLPPEEARLKSRKPPLKSASQMLRNPHSSDVNWTTAWEAFNGPNYIQIADPTKELFGMNLPRREWSILNRFRTGVGRCNYWKAKWGLAESQACDCGADFQTMEHIVNSCPLRCFSAGIQGLNVLTDEGMKWLRELDLAL